MLQVARGRRRCPCCAPSSGPRRRRGDRARPRRRRPAGRGARGSRTTRRRCGPRTRRRAGRSVGPMSISWRGEAGDLGVGRVHHEEVDALLAEAREGAQVGDAAVEGQLVHLEVAGVEHGARWGAHEDGERVGDRVVDGDELEVEGRLELIALALLDGERDRRDAVLLELGLEERERQLRADEGDVAPAGAAGTAPRRCGPRGRA